MRGELIFKVAIFECFLKGTKLTDLILYADFRATLGAPVPVEVKHMETKEQNNNYDCGMHVLEITHQLMKKDFENSGVTSWDKELAFKSVVQS